MRDRGKLHAEGEGISFKLRSAQLTIGIARAPSLLSSISRVSVGPQCTLRFESDGDNCGAPVLRDCLFNQDPKEAEVTRLAGRFKIDVSTGEETASLEDP
eukprot:CAMPEP_0194482964 /NCGR_PEP_ID=MMETSP0253-20130528/4700_1 /TAXON_ID=2966 /ORGANISM="Noctiluca scintillans" /LENGTH=99 /DNA_ID=CAMNT_0039322551 /DNA_START=468 /DNA_END=764 /DNA_ORIENTATION=-